VGDGVQKIARQAAVARAQLDHSKSFGFQQLAVRQHVGPSLEGPGRNPLSVGGRVLFGMGVEMTGFADPHRTRVVAKARIVQRTIHIALECEEGLRRGGMLSGRQR
jgi:hypothetical protein